MIEGGCFLDSENDQFIFLGNTEKISIIYSVWLPILIITTISLIFTYGINEK